MWCLARYLPMLIGTQVPDDHEHWKSFLQLLKIVGIIFSPIVTPGVCAYVQVLIEEHLTAFGQLYPESTITPKMHYLMHYPRNMLR